MKKLILALSALAALAAPRWAFAYQGPEPEANYARIGASTITVSISSQNWVVIPATTSPVGSGRSAIRLDLLNGTTSQSVRLSITTSTLPPNLQYGVTWGSHTVPGQFEMSGSQEPLILSITNDLYVWACTTSTFYNPANLPKISAQELKPRP